MQYNPNNGLYDLISGWLTGPRCTPERKRRGDCLDPLVSKGLRLARLCRGECLNPSDRRRPIRRIEVVRIRPRATPSESLDALIEDPWRVLPCDGLTDGCSVEFEDPDFARDRRDTVYYVRAIEAAAPTINAGGLRCDVDASGGCLEPHPCIGVPDEDDCLRDAEPRAWSSPIFVDWLAP